MDHPALHDAVLHTIEVDWAARSAQIRVSPSVAQGSDVVHRVIRINDLRSLNVPLCTPWGPSIFINECRTIDASTFEVEMQSGDVLKFITNGPVHIEVL